MELTKNNITKNCKFVAIISISLLMLIGMCWIDFTVIKCTIENTYFTLTDIELGATLQAIFVFIVFPAATISWAISFYSSDFLKNKEWL